MQSTKQADNYSKTHRNKNQAKFLVREDLNALLFEAIQKRNFIKVLKLIDYVMQNNKSIDLKNLKAAISQADPDMIQLIIPHCGFSKPSDLYIPREVIIQSGEDYEDCVNLLLNWNFIVNPDSKNDEELVHAAVEKGYLPIVLQLLDHGVDVNMVNSATGINLLTIACVQKHHEIIKNLLNHNADVNVVTPGKNKRLNEEPNFSRNLRTFTKIVSPVHNEDNLCDVTCLHIAVFNSDLILTKLLLKYGAKPISDSKFFHLAYLAIMNEHEDIFHLFLKYGVNVTNIGYRRKTFLHACVYSDSQRIFISSIFSKKPDPDFRYNIAEWLLENGAHICLKTPRNSLVFEAVANKHRKTAQLFLDYDPDVQYISSDGNTALHEAIENDFSAEFIKTLLKLNSPVNIANGYGSTPLLIACEKLKDSVELIKEFIHCNANVNCIDNDLMTPLHFACIYQRLELVKLFLNSGANRNVQNDYGKTPLHCVCQEKVEDKNSEIGSIIELLLEHDVDVGIELLMDNYVNVNHKDSKNSTALHIAVKTGHCRATSCLLKNGANIDALDNNEQTPLQIARKRLLYFQSQIEDFQSSEDDEDDDQSESDMWEAEARKSIKIYKKMVEILVRHAVKLKVAGLEVNQRITWKNDEGIDIVVFENNSTFIKPWFKARYVKEIEKMKMENIGTTDITFYDLLTKNVDFLSRFVDNEVILEALENDFYKTKFPIYINIVRNRFREAIFRCKLIDFAGEYFRKNICEKLPDECTDLICSYLSIDELLNLVRAIISFDN